MEDAKGTIRRLQSQLEDSTQEVQREQSRQAECEGVMDETRQAVEELVSGFTKR